MTVSPTPVLGRPQFSMSELVERVGVPAATVRYYLAEGLLPPPVKVAANRFLYDERHVEIVRLVRLLRERRGLPLEQIRTLLPELVPDLTGAQDGGTFRIEMWRRLLDAHPAAESRADTTARLVEVGLDAFARHGFAEVAIEDVCRGAAIAKGTFYRHFASKSELFFAVADQAAARARASLIAEERAGFTLLERVADAVEPSLTVILDLASLASQRRPGHARALRAFLSSLAEALAPNVPELSADELAEIVEVGVARAVRRVTADSAPLPAVALLGEQGDGR